MMTHSKKVLASRGHRRVSYCSSGWVYGYRPDLLSENTENRAHKKLKVSAEGRTLGRGEACRAERGADAECEGSERGEERTLGRELVGAGTDPRPRVGGRNHYYARMRGGARVSKDGRVTLYKSVSSFTVYKRFSPWRLRISQLATALAALITRYRARVQPINIF